MKRANGLFEPMISFDNLIRAAGQASRGKRHKPAVARFMFDLEPELLRLQAALANGTYRPGRYTVFEIRDPKRRRICAAPFRDRVVHHAVCNLLEPHLDNRLIFDTYACRTGKGGHAAIRRAQRFARRYPYFLKCDIRRYFESIDHNTLKALLRRIIKDCRLLALLDTIIDHHPPYTEPGRGLPIGNLTSQHFANLYLGELDHHVKERMRLKAYIRYMDDLLFFGDNKSLLHRAAFEIERFVRSRLILKIKEDSVQLAPVTEGISFLGFRIFPATIRLNHRSLRRFRRKRRAAERAYLRGETDADQLAATATALFGHIRHADSLRLRRRLNGHTLVTG
jgi:retron-type reverse transcriptase